MADPVLLFQFPEMDVRLEKHRTLCVKLAEPKHLLFPLTMQRMCKAMKQEHQSFSLCRICRNWIDHLAEFCLKHSSFYPCPKQQTITRQKQLLCSSHRVTHLIKTNEEETNTHVRFVVGADFLDPDVILGVYKWLRGAVGLSDGHHARNVLEVTCVINFHLQTQITGGQLCFK